MKPTEAPTAAKSTSTEAAAPASAPAPAPATAATAATATVQIVLVPEDFLAKGEGNFILLDTNCATVKEAQKKIQTSEFLQSVMEPRKLTSATFAIMDPKGNFKIRPVTNYVAEAAAA